MILSLFNEVFFFRLKKKGKKIMAQASAAKKLAGRVAIITG